MSDTVRPLLEFVYGIEHADWKKTMVPAQGFEPWTIGLKVRPDLCRWPPLGSGRIRFSASRLLETPATAPAWLYKLAMHP
jgi:hypothetical protein